MTSHSSDLKFQHRDTPQTIRVRLLYFGAARGETGRDEEQLEVRSPATAASVFEEVLNAHPALRRFGRSLLVAVNEEYAGAEAEVRDGDEVAVFPPVSGGSGEARAGEGEAAAGDFFELTTDPINVGAVARRVVPPRAGATVTLDGYVRQFTRGRGETLYLVYEAYAPMALRELRRLGREAHEKFDIAHVGIVHRTGRLEIGETSVVISVSAPHRRAAFEACEWAIRELKRTVPIWKKEFFEGGEIWVEGEGAPTPFERDEKLG
ncbi:MAG TPA: molybdopterin converting factor subunit 1 [Pyrinomonadaceae bacterium]|nr:molybdopterin converting factor subunit 1 [Pyrinomonadaceae bacterium]